MVVECIGLPGSGKTYLMRRVGEALASEGVRVVNGSDLAANDLLWKAGKKVLHHTIFLDSDARRLRGRLEEILQPEKPLQSRYGIYRDECFTLESAAIFRALYARIESADTVYLFDEGLVHTIVKFCAEFHLGDRTFLEMMAACGPFDQKRRVIVHNKITVDGCIGSIRKRDRHVCAFDELPEERLREILAQYERFNACFAAHYPVVAVSREEAEEEKVRRICGEILRRRR